ncbi:MAG: hypothetical protein U0W40_15520 [Acidimicrobiia bacterium]
MEILVPAADATIDELSFFALRYDGYGLHGGVSGVADIGERVEQQWRDGSLPADLDELRAALFFVQRAAHWNGNFDLSFARALIEQIREVSGRIVDGRPDITMPGAGS